MTEDNTRAGQGPVLLDIGGDVGALVAVLPDWPVGAEIEARPVGFDPDRHGDVGPVHHPHAGVVPRPTADGRVLPSLVLELPAGSYQLHRLPDGPPGPIATVVGGRVTEVTWRS
ncbi:MAG TPA: hypothetical protein VF109_04995 [Mycobacteriales bacterium]